MLISIYVATILFSFHSFIVIYINSSFLGQFLSPSQLGLLYIVGSALNISFISIVYTNIARVGAHRFMLSFILLEAVAVLGLATSQTAASAVIFFIFHQAAILMIIFLFDLFLERATYKETYTGRIRSIYLTASNIALVISPLVAGLLLGKNENFSSVYSMSFLFLVPLFFIILFKFPTTGVGYKHVHFLDSLKKIWGNHNKRDIIFSRFLLEFFFAIMVIYTSIYLHKDIGFSWQQIGLMFTIMLLPFVFMEIPLGNLSDKKIGEKEILVGGFLVCALATTAIVFIHEPIFLLWATVLFATRVGASAVEIGTESFFFKQVNERDAGAISLFRATRPLSYIVAAASAAIILEFFPFYTMFLIAALAMVIGSAVSLLLNDTK